MCCRSLFGYAAKYAAKGRRNFLRLHLLLRKIHRNFTGNFTRPFTGNFTTKSTKFLHYHPNEFLVAETRVKARCGLQSFDVQADFQRFKLDWERIPDQLFVAFVFFSPQKIVRPLLVTIKGKDVQQGVQRSVYRIPFRGTAMCSGFRFFVCCVVMEIPDIFFDGNICWE